MPSTFASLSKPARAYVALVVCAGTATIAHSLYTLIQQPIGRSWLILAVLTSSADPRLSDSPLYQQQFRFRRHSYSRQFCSLAQPPNDDSSARRTGNLTLGVQAQAPATLQVSLQRLRPSIHNMACVTVLLSPVKYGSTCTDPERGSTSTYFSTAACFHDCLFFSKQLDDNNCDRSRTSTYRHSRFGARICLAFAELLRRCFRRSSSRELHAKTLISPTWP